MQAPRERAADRPRDIYTVWPITVYRIRKDGCRVRVLHLPYNELRHALKVVKHPIGV